MMEALITQSKFEDDYWNAHSIYSEQYESIMDTDPKLRKWEDG